MAKCPYCESELPGLERICASCCEKEAGAVERPVNWLVVLVICGVTVAALVILPRMPRLSRAIFSALEYLDSGFVKLGLVFALSKLVLSTATVAWGTWDSWKWRSGWNMLFWLAYVPVFIGFLFTSLTGHLTWSLVALGGFSLVAILKIGYRIRFARL